MIAVTSNLSLSGRVCNNTYLWFSNDINQETKLPEGSNLVSSLTTGL